MRVRFRSSSGPSALVAASLALFALSTGAQDSTCEACSPDLLMKESEKALLEATRIQLRNGRMPTDRPAIFMVAARIYAETGQPELALPVAQRAAGACMLRGDAGCAETIAFLAELTLNKAAGDPDLEDEALAYLSLLPYERLGGDDCASAVSLRYRLSERRSPRAARASWADRCGAAGQSAEPAYRAAKASVLRGAFEDAETRLQRLRAFSTQYAVRAAYLVAVMHVAQGHLNAAQRAFSEIVALPPSAQRSEEEDDARILAALQLARVQREQGHFEEAFDAYRLVPSGSESRAEALLEGAVVAAHIGDMKAAQNYLQALPAYKPQVNQQLDMHRLMATLAIVNGREEEALETFKTLTALGAKARHETFGAQAPDPRARLNDDPSLNGLLNPGPALRLVALERSMLHLRLVLDEQREQIADIRKVLDAGGPQGPLKRALDKLEGADVLLRRAEKLLALRASRGIKLAGPAEAALDEFRRVTDLRARLERALAYTRAQHDQQRAILYARLSELEKQVAAQERTMADFDRLATDVLGRRRDLLVERAYSVVRRLEMSEDVGMLEITWQRKRRATAERQELNEDYNRNVASLKADAD